MSSAGLGGYIDFHPAASSRVVRQILCPQSRTSPLQMGELAQIDHANHDCLAQNNDSEADFVELEAVKKNNFKLYKYVKMFSWY